MALWLVRAGRNGEQEEGVLQHSVATIGWNELGDVSTIDSRDALKEKFQDLYPNKKKMAVAVDVGQVWAFVRRIEKDDLVVLPLKLRAAVAIGRIIGGYSYRTDFQPGIHHVRPVEWIQTDLPRTMFEKDLLYSFGAFMTVCQIQRNNAEERVRQILGKGVDPGTGEDEGETAVLDVEQIARDQVLDFINRKFKGHNLARLVEALLEAQGYITRRSEPGPDGGVDILAGAGSMGFDSPRLCVQVKSSQSPADVTVLRSLQGTLNNFAADQGLLVSWGGFNRAVLEESRRSFFTIRLWDSGDLLESLLDNYERLPATIQAELPLKRIWGLVLEEDVE